MNLDEFDFSLRWPRELFLWEGQRIASQKSEDNFLNMVAALFAEAFQDEDVAENIEPRNARLWSPLISAGEKPRDVLEALLKNPSRLKAYEPRKYWIERTSGVSTVAYEASLSKAFVELINELRELNYFPKVLREQCIDDNDSWSLDPSPEISRAIHAEISWPTDFVKGTVSNDVLYSVIEYFHDQAQRPRTRFHHDHQGCGYHHNDHNKQSGAVVYRWYINALLEQYGIELRLSSAVGEQGHLIRHSKLALDDLADQLALPAPGTKTEDGTIADAIRLYRSRESTSNTRRAAVTQLIGVMEKHRSQFKKIQFTSGDENDLFGIFNNFNLRHSNETQKGKYSDDFLDWIYWITLSAIQLLKTIAK